MLILVLSANVYADTAEECLDESVETAVSVKMSAISGGKCDSIDKESFMSFEEDRLNKKRFLKNAKAALAKGESIPASIFENLDETGSGKMLDKSNICQYLQEKNLAAIKKNVMQDCSGSGASEIYQWGLKKSELKDYSLAHVCNKIEDMKQQACKDSKVVYKAFSTDATDDRKPASVPSIESGSNASRASRQ